MAMGLARFGRGAAEAPDMVRKYGVGAGGRGRGAEGEISKARYDALVSVGGEAGDRRSRLVRSGRDGSGSGLEIGRR